MSYDDYMDGQTSSPFSDDAFMQFREPARAVFEPKEDITAYELAKCLFVLHGQPYFTDEWDSLGSWTRHFRRV